MKKKLIIILSILLFTIGCSLFLIKGTPSFQAMLIDEVDFSSFESSLQGLADDTELINLTDYTDFQWSTCYIFPAYYSTSEMYEVVGKNWTTFNTYIMYQFFGDSDKQAVSEGQFTLVFTDNKDVIASKVYSINGLNVTFTLGKSQYSFTRQECTFNVSSFADGSPIKELALIK